MSQSTCSACRGASEVRPLDSIAVVALAHAIAALFRTRQNERERQLLCAKVIWQPAPASDERFNSNVRRVAAKPVLHRPIAVHFARLIIDDGHHAAGGRADRRCAREHDAGRVCASATEGPRPMGRRDPPQWTGARVAAPGHARQFRRPHGRRANARAHTGLLLSALGFTPAGIQCMETKATL